MSKLDEIFAHKRTEIATQKAALSLAEMTALAAAAPSPRDFIAALRQARPCPALIAEIKRGSPSRGLLVADFDPLRLAAIYAENGAAAISVLTDERFFGGSLDHLRAVAEQMRATPTALRLNTGAELVEAQRADNAAALRQAQDSILTKHDCGTRQTPGLPLLRKDFICDAYQVYQARAAGADAILLIVAALAPDLLVELLTLAHDLGMAALVETHDEAELKIALASRARLIGINNRNLHDFSVSLETTLRLGRRVPAEVCLIAESGIFTAEDVARLAEVEREGGGRGVDAILVGEALVTAADVAAKVRALSGTPPRMPGPPTVETAG
jgi:indole-3-glycerol phosphate synthase